MLIIRRAVKAETLISVLQSFCTQLSKKVGVLEEKQGIVMHHSQTEWALFNRIFGYKEPSNVLNIAALLEHAKLQDKPFLWMAYEKNIHLHQYLIGQGLEQRESMQGFFFNLTWQMPDFESHPAVQLLEVSSEEQFYEWAHVFSICHGIDFESVCQYFQSGYGEDKDYSLYMAQVYQKTIACCAFYIQDKQAMLLWDSVLPMYRRQGVGSMMALAQMKMAKEAGCEAIYAIGMLSYAAMLKDIGFKAIGKFNSFYYCPEQKDG